MRTARNCTYFALFHIFSLEMNFDKDFSKLFSVLDVKGVHTMVHMAIGNSSKTSVKTFCKLGNLCYQLLRGKSFFSGAGVGPGWELQARTSKNLCL